MPHWHRHPVSRRKDHLDFEKATPPPTNSKTIMSQTHHGVEVSFSGAEVGGAEVGACIPGKWLISPILFYTTKLI